MDANSEKRLQGVHPILADKTRQLAAQLLEHGIEIRVVQGLRTYAEQAELYAKGRSTPGARVTNAPPGSSYHNYGLAVDVCPGIPGSNPWKPDWTLKGSDGNLSTSWAAIRDGGTSLGLCSGATFHSLPDYPHLQLTGKLPIGKPTDEAKQLLVSKGIKAVWVLAGIPVQEK